MSDISHVVRFTVPLDREESKSVRKRGNFHSLSRKSGNDALNSTKRSHSSLSTKSWKHRSDSIKSIHSEMNSQMEQPIKFPSNRFDACQVGKACLVESIRYMEEVSRTIRINDSLKNQTELTEFVNKILSNWRNQHDRLHHNQKALQLRYAPDYPLDDRKSINGETLSGTGSTKFRLKIRKSASNLSHVSTDTVASKRDKNPYGSTTSLAKEIHVAPRLLPTGSKNIEEPPMLDFTDELEILDDPFACLGPVEFFNAQNEWSPPKTVKMTKDPVKGYGFSIKGECPIRIINCDPDSPAQHGGLHPGDVLVAINSTNVLWMLHREAVELVRKGFPEPDGTSFNEEAVEMVFVSPKN